jgi:hypothetical protein
VRTVDLPGYDAVLSARLGRRGAQRVVLAARDSAGRRDLVSTAEGFWRWAFRGGAEREAYRAMLAAGVEWLLRGVAPGPAVPLVVAATVPRGLPVPVRWVGEDTAPESLTVTFTGRDTSVAQRMALGADGAAHVELPVGTYRWRVEGIPGANGITVVEAFSPEFVPRTPAVAAGAEAVAAGTIRAPLRELWWAFGLVALALLAEWGWRLRRGLP